MRVDDRTPLGLFGRLLFVHLPSRVLEGNALGDASLRELALYVPPGVTNDPVPATLLLSAFTGTPAPLWESHPWKRGALWTWDAAIARGDAPPMALVMPDTFTRMGGSQFVNSSATGRWQDYVLQEVLPAACAHAPIDPKRIAAAGKSSGGFGALHLCMQSPGTFRAVASIAGDCHFEYGYGSEFLAAARGLAAHGGDPRAFLDKFYETSDLGGDGHAVLNLLAMSACYSPNPANPLGFDLPIDLRTGARIDAVWQRWLAFDPVIACAAYPGALTALDLLYLEAGSKDEFHLQFSLRILVERLRDLGIACEHVEFEGGHFGMDRRFAEVLPRLARALHGGPQAN
ncbi:MAG: alpha/beta hydrolase-fold protein [Planctomycetota bacterium]